MKKNLLLLIMLLDVSLVFSVEYLSEQSDTLDIYFEKLEDGGYSFYGDNRHFIPQYISLGFTKLSNLKIDRENPVRVVMPPGAERVYIASLVPIKKNASYSFRSRLSYTSGDPLTVVPDNFNYLLPFKHGMKYKLDQGFGGRFSHQGENYYALDFSMDVGTPVYAARDGVVIEVKEDSNRGGRSAGFAKYGNYIAIYHSDGTFASYVHLKQNGAIVTVGDNVQEGDLIGYSGNTGLSTGPHLHFSVNIPTENGVRQSIPIKLRGIGGEAIDPVVGEYYYASHPDKPAFNPIFGKDIMDSDYRDYLVSIPQSDTLEFRDETIDSTTVLFCRNGYDSSVDATFSFSLQNSKTSRKTPITMSIPGLSEIYICLVRPKNREGSFAFSYSVSYRVLE